MQKVLLIGPVDRISEWMLSPLGRLKPEVAGETLDGYSDEQLADFHTAFHLSADEDPTELPVLLATPGLQLFVSAAKTTLSALVQECNVVPECRLLGLCALPTLLNRPRWELSAWTPEAGQLALSWLAAQGQQAELVADRVGMVTPRVLSMIINEAFWLLQEGGAQATDIDHALRLGVNYPYGPFEWVQRLGARHVVEVLQNLADAYGNETYKISDLLYDRMVRESLVPDLES